ncbi:MAG: dimethylamine monooxygenase subunit DmmA family protein [Paracoccaceae bacterium]
MTKTEFPPTIKSRPVYGVLEPRPASLHVFVADGSGAEAVIGILTGQATMLHASHILYTPGPDGIDQFAALQATGAAQVFRAPTVATLLTRLQKVVVDAHMGTQFYLSGTEGLMGQAEREIMATGFPYRDIQKEHRGSTVRRVQCVHCKGITENVATDPFECSHCGLNLFVRDHYSRRLAAFQGVNIDAEEPGNVPPAIERFK